jgi:hypothetical protein
LTETGFVKERVPPIFPLDTREKENIFKKYKKGLIFAKKRYRFMLLILARYEIYSIISILRHGVRSGLGRAYSRPKLKRLKTRRMDATELL